MAQGNARSRRTRLALLAAARTLVVQEGIAAVTMSSVAEHAGVTRRAVYLHFASRAELITALYEYVDEAAELNAPLKSVWLAPDAATALDRWAHHLARCHTELIPVGRAFQRVRGTDPDAGHYWDVVMRLRRKSCRRLAEWLAAEARLAPPWTVETAADMLWAMMSFDVLEALVVDRRWSRKRLERRLSVMLRSTFVAEPQPAKRAAKGQRRSS